MKSIHDNMSFDARSTLLEHRGRLDLLRRRASILTGRDKLLMTMYLENGNTFRQMAQLAGVSERSIGRRIHRITSRLLNCGYVACLRNRENMSPLEMAIAKDYFLHGFSMRKIARRRRCTFYHVRKTMLKIKDLAGQYEKSA